MTDLLFMDSLKQEPHGLKHSQNLRKDQYKTFLPYACVQVLQLKYSSQKQPLCFLSGHLPSDPKKSFPKKGNPGRLARTIILKSGWARITFSDNGVVSSPTKLETVHKSWWLYFKWLKLYGVVMTSTQVNETSLCKSISCQDNTHLTKHLPPQT